MCSVQLSILLVEDNRADRALIRAMLAGPPGERFDLQEAYSLASARGLLNHREFDAILLDLSLPDATELEGCVALRDDWPSLPIVVLTGYDDEELSTSALQRGAQDYLIKGRIDRDLLVRSLRYAIERKKIEVALQSARNELEQRVATRTTELTKANLQLQKEIAEREIAEERERKHREDLAHISRLDMIGEMATNLAHEINQPLAAIVGYTGSCLRRLRSGNWDVNDLTSTLEKVASEAKRGGEIIRRLRQLVRKRTSEPTRFSLNDLVRDALALSEPEARARRIVVAFLAAEDLPPVYADLIQIEQVVLNLLRNAFEAVGHGYGHCREVRVQTKARERNVVEFAVSNSDTGAPVEDLECLFEPFYSTKHDGLGMGLAICRTIMETHDGQLVAERNTQEGLTFRGVLPIAGSVHENHGKTWGASR